MIPIIVGWGKDAKPIAYLGIIRCPNCRNYDHFQLYEVAKKVSAFFVPVAKWGKKWYMGCNVCDAALEVSEADKDQLLRDSLELPSVEDVMALWGALDATMQRSVEDGVNIEDAFKAAMTRLETQHPKPHVEYICAVYAEYLQDEDHPE